MLPDWEVLPYDIFSPHPDIVSERLRTLSRLPGLRRGILLLAIESLLTRLPPVPYVQARSFELQRGEPLAIEPLRLRLAQSGYASVGQVSSPGEFALRGSLFDVFPMGSPAPVRVDLLDERIESIRRFDPDSQRSLESVEQLRLLPARELPLDAEAVRAFRRRFRARFEGDISRMSVYRAVSEGIAPPGIEFYLPLFFDSTAQITDYVPRRRSGRERCRAARCARARLGGYRQPLRGSATRHRAAAAASERGVRRAGGAAGHTGSPSQRQHRALCAGRARARRRSLRLRQHRAAGFPARCAGGPTPGAAHEFSGELPRSGADCSRLAGAARSHRRDAARRTAADRARCSRGSNSSMAMRA